MKTIVRISIEIIIISTFVIILNNSFGQEWKQEIPALALKSGLIGVGVSAWSAKELSEVSASNVYDALRSSGYVTQKNLLPIMGYDPKDKKIIPLTMYLKYPLGKEPIPGGGLSLVLAGFRDSVTTSHNDLEERVRKLENKVVQLEKECCK
jgi:hypothetical protein